MRRAPGGNRGHGTDGGRRLTATKPERRPDQKRNAKVFEGIIFHGIVKAAGVSVVRAQREVAYGWFCMGRKRRENYDDWWRCEVSFEPDLDEYFGLTHSKQGINPTAELRSWPIAFATRRTRRLEPRPALVTKRCLNCVLVLALRALHPQAA